MPSGEDGSSQAAAVPDAQSQRVEASAEYVFGRLNQAQAAFDAAKAEGTSRSQLTLIIVWTWAAYK
jgi:hypothetical protein